MQKKTLSCIIPHTDTTMERNTLMAKCYPRIKDYCREKHGLEFQVIDPQPLTFDLESSPIR